MIPQLLITKDKDQIEEYVQTLAQKNNISMSHILRFEPETNTITIDQIRQINAFSLTQSVLPRICVIYRFDLARTEAQNALLKSIEERGETIYFILTAHSESPLLPTIISRVHTMRLASIEKSTRKADRDYSDAGMPLAQKLLKTHKISRDQALVVLEDLLRSEIAVEHKATIMQTHGHILRNNINPEYALDSILLKL